MIGDEEREDIRIGIPFHELDTHQIAVPKKTPQKQSVNECIAVYSLPKTIEKAYMAKMTDRMRKVVGESVVGVEERGGYVRS